MAASHAPVAPFGFAVRATPSATTVRLVVAVLIVSALAAAGVVLAFSLPHSHATPPGTFLGPTPTAPQP